LQLFPTTPNYRRITKNAFWLDTMKIVIAPDSFKESLSATEVAESIATGFKRIIPEAKYHLIPIADGGEGTMTILVSATSGSYYCANVRGAYNSSVKARWGVLGDNKTAVIEAAQAIGLGLTPPNLRDPAVATSYGVGELILAALDKGYRSFVVALGGSSTNDGGSGMLNALGCRFLNQKGICLPPGGQALTELAKIDLTQLDNRIKESSFKVAYDVKNPLLGEAGATRSYAAQKGACPQQIAKLEAAMSHYASIANQHLQCDLSKISGSGAAGGLAFAIASFLKGELMDGFGLVAQAVCLEELLADATLAITAEGQINWQTASGKAPIGVAKIAKRYGVPVVALAGQLGPGFEEVYKQGISAVFSITPGPISLEEALINAPASLSNVAENIARLLYLQ
jgi:glycerate kinase